MVDCRGFECRRPRQRSALARCRLPSTRSSGPFSAGRPYRAPHRQALEARSHPGSALRQAPDCPMLLHDRHAVGDGLGVRVLVAFLHHPDVFIPSPFSLLFPRRESSCSVRSIWVSYGASRNSVLDVVAGPTHMSRQRQQPAGTANGPARAQRRESPNALWRGAR